ncbi:MAG: leucine--tRNA ligase [Parachlamydiales bacterium]|jgi:leucyl-tRNA synthetase
MAYEHQRIEKKWQSFWEKHKTFKADNSSTKPKYYVLDMFPYPSGAGLHVGHVEGYTASDIISRYKRQKGFEVLHPMGWDSFGLPAEQYAIRTGTHPAVTTKKNIDTYRRQLHSLGFSYDWEREFATSDAKYYKWTQWIFTILYNKGLAYEAEMYVNYCPVLGTVLSNEEVDNGRAIEGGHLVERRPLKQWILKITEYADQLLEDLADLDWPDYLKRLQINWIGKSEGAHVQFRIKDHSGIIKVFTTRPDTLFGATYMVLAPEHPLIEEITTATQKAEVNAYKQKAANETDLDRTALNKDKSGVFTGAYALHPITQEPVPIWISDYVLMTYGTGAIMAVPAHDERDFEFAQAFHLPIRCVYDVDSKDLADNPNPEELKKKILAGEACWPGSGKSINSQFSGLDLNGLSVEEAKKKIIDWLEANSSGKRATSYKLRDWLFARQRYWGEPFPILHFADGTKRVLDLDELPLCPPELSNYAPSPEGLSPLGRAKEWVDITDQKTGKQAKRDLNTMPQWAGSCWYYLRFCDPTNDEEAWSPASVKKWLPVDLYIGGVEHAVLHLLYSRFWHKVLYDCGLVPTKEPFKCLRNPGMVTARSFQLSTGAYVEPVDTREENGEFFHVKTGEKLRSQIDKMSKSKLNGVTPDEIIEEFGADSLRLYEMFMGPLEKEKIWNTDAVNGCYRFLNRFYDMATSSKITDQEDPEAMRIVHKAVHGIEKDIQDLQFNTAIAKMMEFINEFTRLSAYPKKGISMMVQVLMPFAPHMAEELWESLGNKTTVSLEAFPEVDPSLLHESSATYVVQVNGKVRARFDMPIDLSQEEVMKLALDNSSVQKFIDGKDIQKVVFVPNRLLNLVV